MKFLYNQSYLIALIASLLFSGPAILADDKTEYHALVKSVYDFSPKNLDKKGIQKASKKLDKFWKSQKKKKRKSSHFLGKN